MVLGRAGRARAARHDPWSRSGPSQLRLTRVSAGRAGGVHVVRVLVLPVDPVGPIAGDRARGLQSRAALPAGVRRHAASCPGRSESALVALLVFAIGIGAIAIVLLLHLATAADVSPLFVGGRLAAPTGYINAHGGAVHDGRAAVDRARLASRAARPAARAAARVRDRRAPARADRAEPRLAVHAAVGRDCGDRARPRPAPRHRGCRAARRRVPRSSPGGCCTSIRTCPAIR